ncbi:MAG: hypothetical protein O3A51_06745, partial [Verrucomicrobia bacterium]|nr:hypothetical protein [Verrucomicrobiota bacterium]
MPTGADIRRYLQLGLFLVIAFGYPSQSDADSPTLSFDLLAQPAVTGTLARVFGHGNADDGFRGVPVCGGHDCDGDGHADTAFSQIQADPLGRTDAGEVTLVFGDGTIGGTLNSGTFTSRVLRVAGDQNHETTGAEVWMDDVTGDGLGDLLIGRQNYTPAAGREGAGALSVIVGGAGLRDHARTASFLDLRSPPTNVTVFSAVGVAAYDRLGIWMRTGDVDGDGIADIVVGADEADATGSSITNNSGSAYVVRGGPHLITTNRLDLAAITGTAFAGHVALLLPPPDSGKDHFGATAQIGDLDGNGRAEVLVAATLRRGGAVLGLPGKPAGTGEAIGGTPQGTVFIAWDENFPASLWPDDYAFMVTNPPYGDYSRIDGSVETNGIKNRHFGEHILAGADFSGDGFPDLYIGDIVGESTNGPSSGLGAAIYNASMLRNRTVVMHLPPADLAYSIVNGPLQSSLGNDAASFGDFDGDGIDDLTIGSPHDAPQGRSDAGSVHIFYGQPGGWPPWIDLKVGKLPSSNDVRVVLISGALGTAGFNNGDVLCYSSHVGDLDADGRSDLIVNEMRGDGPGGIPEDVGNMLLISGSAFLDSPSSNLVWRPSGCLDFGAVPLD